MKPMEKTRRKMGRPEHDGKRAQLRPIGLIRSSIKQRSQAPKARFGGGARRMA